MRKERKMKLFGIGKKREKGKAKKKLASSITLHSFPKLVFTWPLILLGFIFYALQSVGWGSEILYGWIYLSVLGIVMMTVAIDMGRNLVIFCLVLGSLIWVGVLYLQDAKGWMIFGVFADYIGQLEPVLSADAYLVSAIVLLILYFIMLVMVALDHRWRITYNEIEHYSFGRRDTGVARGAKTAVAGYSDVLEVLLGLSGSLKIFDSRGEKVILEIENILFLPFRMKTISRILEATSITSAMAEEEGEEDGEE